MGISLRARVLIGSAVWLAGLGGGAALLASPGVRQPLARTLRTLADDAWGAPERERVFAVEEVRGVELGAPVFLASDTEILAPVGHVTASSPGSLTVRYEPGACAAGPASLVCLSPSRSLSEALALAVTPEAAERLDQELRTRLAETLEQVLLPGVAERLPAFWRRLDPAGDPEARALLDDVGRALLTRLTPHLDSLAGEIAAAVKSRFDFLDRVGLLWKVLRGDAQGLAREIEPIAKQVAAGWWKAHDRDVLGAAGQALSDHRERLEAWVRGPVWTAARDELLAPVVRAERGRLEAQLERLLRRAAEEVALAPGGGFRPRFANILRTHLLGRGEALVLLVREEPR